MPNHESRTEKHLGEFRGTVILGHAMFNTFDYFFRPEGTSLATFLSKNGFDVTSFNLTGYGRSAPAKRYTGFSEYVEDYKRFFEDLSVSGPLFFIGHSVGGMAGFSALSYFPGKFKKVILAGPAIWPFVDTSVGIDTIQKLKIRASMVLALPFGFFPMKLLGLGDSYAPYGHFAQLDSFGRQGKMVSKNGVNHTDLWKNVDCSTTILSGALDLEMAPEVSVNWIKKQIGDSVQVDEVSKDSRFQFDADHFGILYGKKAAKHVWPELVKLLS